jgi:hypothetical protein
LRARPAWRGIMEWSGIGKAHSTLLCHQDSNFNFRLPPPSDPVIFKV